MSDDVRAWLDHTQKLDQAATPGPWVWSEPDPEWTGDYYGVWERDEDMPPVAATHAPGEYGKADAEWIAHARTALPAAVAALRAILDLHAFDAGDVACGNPRHTSLDVGCPECYYPCQGCAEPYPCPTVAAIHDKIGDGHE